MQSGFSLFEAILALAIVAYTLEMVFAEQALLSQKAILQHKKLQAEIMRVNQLETHAP